METIRYTAPAISCNHCKMTIERALGTLGGIQSVTVEVPTKSVTIEYDPGQVTPTQLQEVLDDEGYPVTP